MLLYLAKGLTDIIVKQIIEIRVAGFFSGTLAFGGGRDFFLTLLSCSGAQLGCKKVPSLCCLPSLILASKKNPNLKFAIYSDK